MSGKITADVLHVRGAWRLDREGAETPIDVPASGILTLSETQGVSITLGGGGALQIAGIEYLDEADNPVVLEKSTSDDRFLRCGPGVSITLLHNRSTDLFDNPLPSDQRLITSSGNDVVVGPENTPVIRAWALPPISDWVWGVADRKGITPSNSADWTAPVPTTVTSAIDRLVAVARDRGESFPGELTLIDLQVARKVYHGPTASVVAVSAILDGSTTALSTATLTLAINGTPVTDGVISIAAIDSGAGTKHTTAPTAANVVTDGDSLTITAGGTNLLPVKAAVSIRLVVAV